MPNIPVIGMTGLTCIRHLICQAGFIGMEGRNHGEPGRSTGPHAVVEPPASERSTSADRGRLRAIAPARWRESGSLPGSGAAPRNDSARAADIFATTQSVGPHGSSGPASLTRIILVIPTSSDWAGHAGVPMIKVVRTVANTLLAAWARCHGLAGWYGRNGG